MRICKNNARWAVFPLMFGLLPCIAKADFTKTIQVMPGVQVNAVTTWYFANCTTSLGVGSYDVNVAPMHGTLTFGAVSGPLPGCPQGSPSLPAVAAYYTWTDTTAGASSDYFQLYYELNGTVAEVIDVTVTLATSVPECSITSQTLATVPGIDNFSRTTIGVGESVKLTTSVPVTWTIPPGHGTLSSDITPTTGFPANAGFPSQQCSTTTSSEPIVGTQACFTASNLNDTTVVTATVNGSACSTTFTTVQPTGLIFQMMQSPPLASPGYRFFDVPPIFYQIGMMSVAFLTPGNVSFANIRISEHDTPTPGLTPQYNLLFPVNGTQAWLVGCDVDVDINAFTDVLSHTSPWVWLDTARQETTFSLVKTQTSHTSLLGDFYYSKGQVQALSADGSLVATPNAPSAMLTVPRLSLPYSNVPFPTFGECVGDVQRQFQKPSMSVQ
jgi:hypothetical protein